MFFFLYSFLIFFFFNDTATTEIYTLSLHDALPIYPRQIAHAETEGADQTLDVDLERLRSEEHTSELQSHHDLVCRLLLEKKNKNTSTRLTRSTHRRRGRRSTTTSSNNPSGSTRRCT